MLGRMFADVPLPVDSGSYDALVLAEVYERVNAGVSGPLPRIGRRAVWAVMRAVREEFPDGGYDPEDMGHRDRVARRAGMDIGVVRLAIAQKVMRAMLAVRAAGEKAEQPSAPAGEVATCGRCGTAVADPAKHELFHQALGEVTRSSWPAAAVEPPRCDPVAGTHTTPHRGCVLR